MKTKNIALAGMFGALALAATSLKVPLYFGNPNLGSTPVSVAAALLPLNVAVITGLLKGIGASLWTGQPYIEMAAGIGDAMMAAFTYFLVKRTRIDFAIVAGQLSRYIFTSGLIAISVAILINGDPGMIPTMWVAIFPAVTLSIVANTAVSLIVVRSVGDRIKEILNLDTERKDKKTKKSP
ncbi:MAG: hypothetical protein ACXQTP_00040 [Candidatus Methanofastidiosia archaeon]